MKYYNETYSSETSLSGFKPYSDSDGGYSGSPDIIWTEGTLGYIALCKKLGNTTEADKYLSQMESLQDIKNAAGGMVYATETYAALPWEFHVWESVVGSAWLYLVINDINAVFPTLPFSTDLTQNTLDAANDDLDYYQDNLAFLKAIPELNFTKTATTYTFESPAVDVAWRLDVGASISSPDSDNIVVYTIKDGQITNNLDSIQKLLAQNDTFTFDGLNQILGTLAVKLKNGRLWIDAAAGGSGFTLHLEKDHTEVNQVQVTEKYEISLTIKFHQITVTTPTETVTDYNNEVVQLPQINWIADGTVVVLLILAVVLVASDFGSLPAIISIVRFAFKSFAMA